MARTYGDRCGVARALDLVGERWALLVVRELLLGPKRFTDLRAGLPQVGPDVLSQRLRELEGAGLVARRTLDPPAAAKVYELTARGAQLEPVILELGRFGSVAPFPDGEPAFGPDALALALKTLYEPGGAPVTVTLRGAGPPVRGRPRDRPRARAPPGALARSSGRAPATARWSSPAAPRTRPTPSSRPSLARSPRCSGTAPTPPASRSPATAGPPPAS